MKSLITNIVISAFATVVLWAASPKTAHADVLPRGTVMELNASHAHTAEPGYSKIVVYDPNGVPYIVVDDNNANPGPYDTPYLWDLLLQGWYL